MRGVVCERCRVCVSCVVLVVWSQDEAEKLKQERLAAYAAKKSKS